MLKPLQTPHLVVRPLPASRESRGILAPTVRVIGSPRSTSHPVPAKSPLPKQSSPRLPHPKLALPRTCSTLPPTQTNRGKTTRMTYPTHLLPTTVVGSYPQPDWLVDRATLHGHGVPRTHAHDM